MTGAIRFCDTCGGVNRMGARFCAHCGKTLPDLPGATGATPNSPLPPLHMLKQRYQIVQKLGEGGFGAIYQAEDSFFNQALRAVKEMRMQQLDPQEAQQAIDAFKQEAMLLASLGHPNLPRIYDYFEDNGRWYLVMDYIEGDPLSACLRQAPDGKLTPSRVLPWALQLCTVLSYLHHRHPPVIFRDLKPANVMVTVDDHIYLIDFGIARLFKPGQAKDTLALGSPGYAAPEQYGKAQTTERSDIYSLGATLHHLLSGRDPSDDPFEFPPLDLDQYAPAGPVLAQLVARMVDIKRENRPASVQDIKQELQQLMQQPWQAANTASSTPVKRTRRSKPTPAQVAAPATPSASSEAVSRPTPLDMTMIANRMVPNTPQSPIQPDTTKTATPTPPAAPDPGSSTPVRSSLVGITKKKPGTMLLTFHEHQRPVHALVWLPDSLHIASGGGDGLRYWDVRKGQVGFSSSQYVHTLDHAPDGVHLVTSAFGLWEMYDVAHGQKVSTYDRLGTLRLDHQRNAIRALAWSPQGTSIAFGMNDGRVLLWDAAAKTVRAQVQPHRDTVTTLTWSPDGQYLASGSRDHTLCVLKLINRVSLYQERQIALEPLYTYTGYDQGILTAAWSPDSHAIAIGGLGKALHICKALTGQPVAQLQNNKLSIETLAWSPDSQHLVYGSQDRVIRICEVKTSNIVLSYTGHSETVNTLAWSPDERMIASGSNDRTVQVWRALF